MAGAAFACSFDMWTSVAWHLYNTMGQPDYDLLFAFDLSGIVACMLAFFVGLAYTLFHDWSWERNLIMLFVTPTIVTNFFVLFHPTFYKSEMYCCKVIIISTTQALLLCTAIYGRLFMSTEYHIEKIYPQIFSAFSCIIIGFLVFFRQNVPECIPILGQYRVV